MWLGSACKQADLGMLSTQSAVHTVMLGKVSLFFSLITLLISNRNLSEETSIETSILSRVKQIASPGWMHDTSASGWCTGTTQRDGMGREVGGGDWDGEHM